MNKDTNTIVRKMGSRVAQTELGTWLCAPDPSKNQKEAIDKFHPDLGDWFLESTEFGNWKSTSKSFLWLHGKSGSVKTLLCSKVIHALQDVDPQDRPIIYSYFDIRDAEKQSLDGMMRSLVLQLSDQNDELRKLCEELHSSWRRKEQPPGDPLRKPLLEMIQSLDEVFIVLDALNECNIRETEKLLSWIQPLATSATDTNIHLLVTSVERPDLKPTIPKCSTAGGYCMHFQNPKAMEEVEAYIRSQVRKGTEFAARWEERPDILEAMETALITGYDGM